MIHQMWFIMMFMSIVYAVLTGRGDQMLGAAVNGMEKSLTLTMQLTAGYLFFCGLTEIAKSVHVQRILEKALRPLLKRLMPNIRSKDSRDAAALNLSMNVLGVGNAATPAGLEAMRRMEKERLSCPAVRHDMEMFLILNATSIQLLPTTVLAMRAAAGSAEVNRVVIPTILCTAFSTVTGVLLGLICRRMGDRKHG